MWGARSSGNAAYVLTMLALANVLNAVDRTIVGLLAEPISRELQITDTQLGLLTGFAFAIFFALFGVPIARWADRGNRRGILAVGIALWSGATLVFGLGTGFVLLLLARIGVAIGEAAVMPTALSLIADYFPPARRARAISIFQSAIFVGLMATSLAGLAAQAWGWRAAFVLVGLVGLAFAAIFGLTVAEPVRGRFDPPAPAGAAQPPLGESLRLIGAQPAYLLILASVASTAMSASVFSAWAPTYLVRVHHLDIGEVARLVGPINGVGGFLGSLLGGFVAAHLVKRTGQERGALWLPCGALMLAVPAAAVFVFSDSPVLAMVALAVQAFLWATKIAPCYAVALSLVPPRLRAFSVSLLLMVSGVVGYGAGPTLVGLFSDLLEPHYGVLALRYALVLSPVAMLIGALALVGAAWKMKPARQGEAVVIQDFPDEGRRP